MFIKNLLIILFLLNYSFASFQEVRIGKIDNYYKDKISKYELRNIIDDIEYRLESQLNENIFDYSENGKNIDIIYLPPSKLENRINKQILKIETKQNRILKLQKYFTKQDKELEYLKAKFEKRNDKNNKKIESINNYIKKINQKKKLTSIEYKKEKKYIENEKLKINKESNNLKSERRSLKKNINNYNQKLHSYNNLIREFNKLNNELERLNRSFKKVKGMTFGKKEIKLKTFYKNGKKIQEKSINNSMNKIEIYGFDNLAELKAIIAHEIMHLVGIPHINIINSLMHPILQKKQVQNINLTNEDIINFKKHF